MRRESFMTDDDTFLNRLPKAELHLHIEGSLEPAMMFDLAARNGVALPYADVTELTRAYDFADLQAFLDLYYAGMSVLVSERDFHDLTSAYLEKAAADGVVHAEIFFDPQGHTGRGVGFEVALDGICSGLEAGHRGFGVTSKLIACFLRHLPEEATFETWADIRRDPDRIVSLGLDSSERGHPP